MTDFEKDIINLQKKISSIDVEAIAVEAVHEHEAEIVDTVTDDQLFAKGIDGTGKKITPKYTPFTKKIKRQKGQPFNRVTLKDTGDFHESVFMEKTDFQIFLNAKDWKTGLLFEKYGEEILDLTKRNKAKLVKDHIKFTVQDKFKKAYESL